MEEGDRGRQAGAAMMPNELKGKVQTVLGPIAPEALGRTLDDCAKEMIGQILHGAWGTEVRAGMIGEIGCQAPWTATEKKVMQAALIAAAETGAAINVHPGRHPDQPQEVADFIKAAGRPTERVVISHIDRTVFDE